MFKVLLKNCITAMIKYLSGAAKNKKNSRGKMIVFALLMVYVVVVFFALMGMLFDIIAVPFYEAGISWLYFTFAGIVSFGIMFVLSIFTAKVQLYEAKDNDLLLSMPIPPKYILLSRAVMLLLSNFLFELIVILPAAFIWIRNLPVTAAGVFNFILVFLALPFFAFALTGIFGYLLALISAKVRNKSLISTVFTLVFLALYMFAINKANVYVQRLAANGTAVAAKLSAAAPLYWLGNSIAGKNIVHLLLTLLVCIVPFLIVYYVLTVSFIKTATTQHGARKIEYRKKETKVNSPEKAFFIKELRRFTSSSAYLINGIFGILLLFIASIVLIVKRNVLTEFLEAVPEISGVINAVVIFAICLFSTLTLISAPSISVEGKSIWLPLSLPIPAKSVIYAKVKLQIIPLLPVTLLASAVSVWAFSMPLDMAICAVIVPAVFAAFSGLLGVVLNLKNPRFDWPSEAYAVKQSMSVLYAMLIGMGVVLVPGVVYFVWLGSRIPDTVFFAAYGIIMTLVCVYLMRWIDTKGIKRFSELGG